MQATGFDLKAINHRIKAMQQAAEELQQRADQFPALDRNVARILASIKMLKLNISDPAEMGLLEDIK